MKKLGTKKFYLLIFKFPFFDLELKTYSYLKCSSSESIYDKISLKLKATFSVPNVKRDQVG